MTAAEPRVLREEDPEVAALLDRGWRTTHRSWGARLHDADPERLETLVAAGAPVSEVGVEADPGIAALAAAVRDDYPGGPATAPAVHDEAALAALRRAGPGSSPSSVRVRSSR